MVCLVRRIADIDEASGDSAGMFCAPCDGCATSIADGSIMPLNGLLIFTLQFHTYTFSSTFWRSAVHMVMNRHTCTRWVRRMQPNVTGGTSCPYKCGNGGGTGGGGIGSVSLGPGLAWQTRAVRAYLR